MASPPIIENSDVSARRAKTRIAVAVALLVVAIGGLALLSSHKPEKHAEEAQSPAQPQKQESISSGEATPPTPTEAPTQISSAQQEPPPPPPTTPSETATEPPPPPPAPVVGKLPPEPAQPAAPSTQRSVTSAVKPEKAAPAPLAKLGPPTPASPPSSVKPAPAPKNFEVQVGVFSDMENAKQLQAKLAEHGIPSHTETRLQVGPFSSKAEADAAQQKLKALGVGAVIISGK